MQGPVQNDMIVSEMLCKGQCGTVFAKCATGIGWLPLTEVSASGGGVGSGGARVQWCSVVVLSAGVQGAGGSALVEELLQPGVQMLSASALAAIPVPPHP